MAQSTPGQVAMFATFAVRRELRAAGKHDLADRVRPARNPDAQTTRRQRSFLRQRARCALEARDHRTTSTAIAPTVVRTAGRANGTCTRTVTSPRRRQASSSTSSSSGPSDPGDPSSSQQDPAGGGHKTPEIHRTIVLHDLRRAGKQGVPLVKLRDHLNGLSARPAIDQLAADGYPVVCCGDHRGRPAAFLVGLGTNGGAA